MDSLLSERQSWFTAAVAASCLTSLVGSIAMTVFATLISMGVL